MRSCEQVTHSQYSPFHQPQIPVVHHVSRLYFQIQVHRETNGEKRRKSTIQSYLFQVRKLKEIFWTEINTFRMKEDSDFVHINTYFCKWNDRGASLVILVQPVWYQESPIIVFMLYMMVEEQQLSV